MASFNPSIVQEYEYWKKLPVRAIQWDGENWDEVRRFAEWRVTHDGADLFFHDAKVPQFWWIAQVAKTRFQCYRDDSFRRIFYVPGLPDGS